MLKDNFEKLMAERNAALASLDMQYARAAMRTRRMISCA